MDDDEGLRILVRRLLQARGYAVAEAATIAAAEDALRDSLPDAVVLDFSLPDGDALGLLRRLRRDDALVPVVLLTAHASIELAVRAIKEGAEQFLVKPVDGEALLVIIDRIVANQRSRQAALAGLSHRSRQEVDPFAGESAAIRKLASQAQRVAATSIPVLIQGETGTGKGVLARWLHRKGSRAEEPFVDLNCAGLSHELLESELFGYERGAFTGAVAAKQGLLELANRGTLFLDEIGDMDVRVQPKLLKVVEEQRFRRLGGVPERRVDMRLISATHRDLGALVREGRFREDLLYRAGAVTLAVPPLRERERDVAVVARRLLESLAAAVGRAEVRLTAAAEEVLVGHSWPGNLRELRNVLERALLFSESSVLEASDLGEWLGRTTQPAEQPMTLADAEKRHIEAVLRAEAGAVERAATILGLPKSTLYDKIRKHGIPLQGKQGN